MEITTLSAARVIIQLTVNPEDWENFLLMISAVKECVKKEGPENVLIHEVYYQKGSFRCLMVESYKDEKAMLEHINLTTPISKKFNVNWSVNRLELMGSYSIDTVGMWKKAAGNGEFTFYATSI